MNFIIITISAISVFIATVISSERGFKKGIEFERALQSQKIRLKKAEEKEREKIQKENKTMKKELYKAISEETQEWVFGLPCYGQERYGQESEIIGIETENDYFDIIPETLCQATGKTDKFGDNLFEGDIIQFIHKLGKDTVRETVTVYYSEQSASFMLGVKDCLLPFGMFNVNEGQIIGNIHDDKLSIKEGNEATVD